MATGLIKMTGRWVDSIILSCGKRVPFAQGKNIITNAGLALIVGSIGGIEDWIKTIEVGSGLASWDISPPAEDPDTTALVTPVYEKDIESVRYWDMGGGIPSPTPTNTIEVTAIFSSGEANATLREFAFKGGASGDIFLNYIIHPAFTKTASHNLERRYYLTAERA